MNLVFPKHLKRLTKKHFLAFIFVFGLASLVAFLAYNKFNPIFKKDGAIYTRDVLGRIVSAEKDYSRSTPSPTPRISEEVSVRSWEIVDNSQTPPMPTGIYFYYNSGGTTDVLKWNEYLVGFTKDYFVAQSKGGCFGGCAPSLQTTIRHIRVLNTKTGDVYSISLQKPTWGEIDMAWGQIIDNTYFLKVGSYGPRSAGFQYQLQLPPHRNSVIEKLQFPIGSIILKFGGYYLTSSCYEGCYYQRVDVTTLNATELKRLNDAANGYIDNKPEKLLGFTKKGEMVLELAANKKVIAVSLSDEKTTREFSNTEEIFDPYKNDESSSKSIQEQFESLKLDSKYVLEQRVAKYQTSN